MCINYATKIFIAICGLKISENRQNTFCMHTNLKSSIKLSTFTFYNGTPSLGAEHGQISARAEIPARLLTYGKEKTNLNKKHEVC